MTLVLAHRGASWDERENTIGAFERAIAEEADYVEFDVRAGPDGRLVVVHDPVRGPLAPEVPTLDEVLETCMGRVGLAVEIKEWRITDATLAALDRHLVEAGRCLVLSECMRTVEHVRRVRPELRTVLHLRRGRDPATATPHWGVGFSTRWARPQALARAKSLGLATLVYTVNEPARMRELSGLGVTGIFTDRPALLRRTLAC